MMIIFFLNGLSFGSLGLAAYLQNRQGGDFPLKKQLPWLAAYGFVCGATSWVEMFISSGVNENLHETLTFLRLVLQPLTGLLLLKFGWGIFKQLAPLPAWMSFIPGVLIVPLAYVITYAATTFITPSPIEIPVDIWSRYLLYLPGSVIAGVGFLRQSSIQRREGFNDVANLMLGAGMAFLFEAFVVGLVVPAAPYGPASYYNYDRIVHNAFTGEQSLPVKAYGLTAWLDYERVLEVTGLPIEFWRMLSTFAVTFFVVRGLGVFEAIRKRQLLKLQEERDRAQQEAYQVQIAARKTAENWSDALVGINRHITQLANVDSILLEIIRTARDLLCSDFVGIGLYDESHSRLLLKFHCFAGQLEIVKTPAVVDNPLILESIQTNQSYRSPEGIPTEKLQQVCPMLSKPAQAIAIVPLGLDIQPIGALWVARCEPGSEVYTGTDLVWLECLADQVDIAIQHGVMTSQMQSLSIIEERARIAREMHDGLAQVLGYLNLQIQTLGSLLQQGKQESLQKELDHMRQAVKLAHADVRENILSLRTTLAHEKGLIASVEEYLMEFGIQSGIETQFRNRIDSEVSLASVAEVQLVCILQEALANVRKHSQAGHVHVEMQVIRPGETSNIQLIVQDDGSGFSPSASRRSFGLQTMRERAESVGGRLAVHSQPGEGTRIECTIPCLQQEKIQRRQLFMA